mmetsp:Transcript_24275/g.66405  ORF Transcript_24275/g.66405 Transcript_24275/m.66405 type:complete len:275 (+) Transcript_24275:1037-1861(+)
MTVLTPMKSMPRPMRSVETSTHVRPLLKLSTAAVRAAMDWLADSESALTPSYISSLCSARARSFVATNTSTGGFSPSVSSCRSASSLPFSRPTNSSRWSTVLTAVLRAPTVTLSGSTNTVLARSSTFSGRVALNSARTMLLCLQAERTASICSTNPISNSLSASSSTRNLTCDKSILPSSARVASLSGLASKMSTLLKLVPAAVERVRMEAFRFDPGSSCLSTRPCWAVSSWEGLRMTALMASGHISFAAAAASAAAASAASAPPLFAFLLLGG